MPEPVKRRVSCSSWTRSRKTSCRYLRQKSVDGRFGDEDLMLLKKILDL